MTAINSNRAIRGPVTAIPVVAGKGVRLTADTQNNRWVVEADETVLYSNDSPSQITSDEQLSLSESYLNFERLKVYFKCSAGSVVNSSYIVESPVFSVNTTEISTQPIATSSGYLQLDCNSVLFYTATPTYCTVKAYGKRMSIGYDGVISMAQNRGTYIYKIVGINRVQGGN